MLQSMGLQRFGHDLAVEQQQQKSLTCLEFSLSLCLSVSVSVSLSHTLFLLLSDWFHSKDQWLPKLEIYECHLGAVSLYSHNQRENTAFLYQLHFEKMSFMGKILSNQP